MNSKTLRIAVCSILVLAICAGYVSAANNLLVNPSFEEVDEYGEPTGWAMYAASPMIVSASITNEMAASGKNSLLCSINYALAGKKEAVLMQDVPVEKNKLYKIGLKYRKENFKETGPYLTINIYDKDGKEIAYTEPLIMKDHNKIDDPLLFWEDMGFRLVLKDTGSDIGEGEWVDHWVIIKTNEDTEFIHVAVGIKVKNPNNTGKVYFDDMYIEEVQ